MKSMKRSDAATPRSEVQRLLSQSKESLMPGYGAGASAFWLALFAAGVAIIWYS